MSVARTWGSTAEERHASYPCDALVPGVNDGAFRAIEVAAPASVVFRWFCQLKVAPYSYDLIDNRGRRSPRKLTPGAEQLEVGQRFMGLFTLAEFEPGREVTLVPVPGSPFSNIAVTYRAVPTGAGSSRIVVKIARRTDFGLRARVLLWGDLLMMHRQLSVLKRFAEKSQGALPFIDRYSVEIAAAPATVWPLPARTVMGAFGRYFRIERKDEPRSILLVGAHRFSRYTLEFKLEPTIGGTRLTAVTHAEFPGILGQIYKTLVIRSRMHLLATRSMLKSIKRRALDQM